MQAIPPIVENTTVSVNTVTSYSQSALTSKYFQTTVKNPNSSEILLITVSADIATGIDIYVITSES